MARYVCAFAGRPKEIHQKGLALWALAGFAARQHSFNQVFLLNCHLSFSHQLSQSGKEIEALSFRITMSLVL